MKNLKIFIVFIVSFIVFTSCNNEDESIEEKEQQNQKYPEISKKLEALHFNTNGLELIELTLLDGTTQEMFLIEGDIVFTKKEIEKMKLGGDINSKQYRTFNLANNGTYTVIGYTGNNSNGLSSKERTALSWAVNNYNSLNLGIHLNLSYGTNWQPKDIVVYRNNIGFVGGLSNFPSGGRPYKFVQINGIGSFNTNVIEHVITHEIGHSFGLRHSDWWSRQSCADGGNEGTGSDGAVHIPGTPTGFDSGSLMNACFSLSSNGEFGFYDRVALNYLY
jgi:hypothetical protein